MVAHQVAAALPRHAIEQEMHIVEAQPVPRQRYEHAPAVGRKGTNVIRRT